MLTVDQALELCLALVAPLPAEEVALRQAHGRMMIEPAIARCDQPPFAASAMDGYALSGDPAPGDSFAVVGEAGAGHGFAGRIGPGRALRIFTGAPVPDGATRVVIQEDVTRDGDRITLKAGADAARHIRPLGGDFAKGDALPPRRLSAHDLALLAAMNLPVVRVARRPVVAIVCTGDELVMPGEEPGPDQIIASNGFALAALIEAEGGIARLLPIARDNRDALRTVLQMALDADLVVTVGGASVGEHDLVGQVAAELGMERAFWKIAMRPGKPLMAGKIGATPLVGLPGNPVSAIVCCHLFVMPMLRALQSQPDPAPRPRPARLGAAVEANGPRTHYMRARTDASDGLPVITPFAAQDSSLLRILSDATAFLIRPMGDSARQAGDMVTYLPL